MVLVLAGIGIGIGIGICIGICIGILYSHIYTLDAIASPSTYPCQWVSQ